MIKDGKGGSNTQTGLVFEKETDLEKLLSRQPNYIVSEGDVYYKDKYIAKISKKHKFYNFLKEKYDINGKDVLSPQLFPDNSIYVIKNKTMFIIECKYQSVSGSVDEKLQTCDFKKKQYQRLLSKANIKVEYIYVLSDFFNNSKYDDVFKYITSVGCYYYFNSIPIERLGLPNPTKTDNIINHNICSKLKNLINRLCKKNN